jgi:hypothetical protein
MHFCNDQIFTCNNLTHHVLLAEHNLYFEADSSSSILYISVACKCPAKNSGKPYGEPESGWNTTG